MIKFCIVGVMDVVACDVGILVLGGSRVCGYVSIDAVVTFYSVTGSSSSIAVVTAA